MIKCSIGVCVYNEEKNIAKLLASLLRQKLKKVKIEEILVIASGSIDRTQEIVERFGKKERRIRLVEQKKREGKALAVNLFIQKAKEDILILLGGDIILTQDVVERIVRKFDDPEVGMTGVRPIPVNNIDAGVCGFAGHLLWELHHRISLKRPKMGEVIAFRKVFRRIPVMSSVDEANIEPLIRGQGFRILYVPEAKIYNKAPTTINDFIKQRRRIYSGHLAVKYEQSYEVATLDIWPITLAIVSFFKENPNLKYFLFTPLVAGLEAFSRFLGWWDYKIAKKKYSIWETIQTTKELSYKTPPQSGVL